METPGLKLKLAELPDDGPEAPSVYGIARQPDELDLARTLTRTDKPAPNRGSLDRRIVVAQMIIEAEHPRRSPWDWDPEEAE